MPSKKVRVAIIGVGNCASSLVQGVQFYKEAADDASVPGIMHARLAGYHIRDDICRAKLKAFIRGEGKEEEVII